ncbi:MAG TPA: hypothetical protein VFE47_09635 [Tepidisphaeraceae bacterium]|jgi:hypothetical protein|nr:hypothetical protein [Tepidisphaeraceae bacterium]
MNEQQRLFLVQAQSDFRVFDLLRNAANTPHCHALHYLQMATEKLGKAYAWRHGSGPADSHRAFVRLLRDISTNRAAQKRLRYDGNNEKWKHVIRKSIPLAKQIEDLAPALADGENPEYPWPQSLPRIAPAEHHFGIWEEIQDKPAGRQFLKLVASLFAIAESFF